MIIYIARCKKFDEAAAIQDTLRALTPTLVYSRILQKPKDLDVFNAEFLQIGDESVALGAMPFGRENTAATLTKLRRSFFILTLLGIASVLLGAALAWFQAILLAAVLPYLLLFYLCLLLLSLSGIRAAIRIPTDQKAFWFAANWLSKGKTVVLAASYNPPENLGKLPKNLQFFERHDHAEA